MSLRTTLFADSKTFLSGSPSSPDLFRASPNKIEITTIARMLFLDSINEKSLTLIAWTVLSKIFTFS